MQFEHSRPNELLENVGDDKQTFLLLIDIFRRESVLIFDRIREAAVKKDLPELGRQSHSLKGTVGPLGAERLVQMLLDIEDECRQEACICDDARLASIENELRKVGAEMDDFISRF